MFLNRHIILFVFGSLFMMTSWSQTIDMNGVIIANGDIENIHVINLTTNKFTTTNALGRFKIPVKYKDTLKFTSVRYKTKTVVITQSAIQNKRIEVYLEENINVLDEVVVGKVLTGDLNSDIKNSDAKREINFYDLGLPGYTGKPLTQSERRLAEARKAQPGVIPLLPLLNAISGRTKMLKERVRLERNVVLMNDIKDRLSQDFFSLNPLDEIQIKEFFFFVSEDENFEKRCRGKSDIHVLEFLKEKYDQYTENIKSKKD